MTAIDQAFIKAYMLQTAASKTAAPDSTGPVPLADPLSAQADVDVDNAATDPSADESDQAGPCDTMDFLPVDLLEIFGAGASPASERPAAPLLEPPADDAAEPSTSAEPDETTPLEAGPIFLEDDPPAPGENVFLPSFQVDSFAWPSGATRLSMVASDQVDQLGDALTLGLDRGQEVVAITGCRRGDGCTTLLLCVARRLAERGLKIAMVDADFDNPLLARRLGLLPETGWEEVLTSRLPVGEVTVESMQDRLAVVPWCGALCREDRPADDAFDLAAGLNVLREHYDLVLIDLGEFGGEEASGRGVFDAVVDWIDAAVLVHNVRSTPQAELNRTRWRIQSAGLVEAGITENFVEIRQSA